MNTIRKLLIASIICLTTALISCAQSDFKRIISDIPPMFAPDAGDADEEIDDEELANLRKLAEGEAEEADEERKKQGGIIGGGKGGKPQRQPNAMNPSICLIGDFECKYSPTARRRNPDERGDFYMKGLGLRFDGDIDTYARAMGVIGFHDGKVHVGELYADIRRLPFGLGKLGKLRVGKWKAEFGRLNPLHKHDLPHDQFPPAHRLRFGGGGLNITGLGMNFAPWKLGKRTAVKSFIYGFQGKMGHGLTPDEKGRYPGQAVKDDPEHPNYQLFPSGTSDPGVGGRILYFTHPSKHTELALGVSDVCGHNDARNNSQVNVFGADFTFRYKPNEYRSIILSGEYLKSSYEDPANGRWTNSPGATFWMQLQTGKHWYFGVRGDWTGYLNNEDTRQTGAAGYLTYYTTPFLRFRFGYEHIFREHEYGENEAVWTFNVTYIFGAHPPHPWYMIR